MSDVRRIDPGPRLSEASVRGYRIYLSGMIPEDTSHDIAGQVKQALAEIDDAARPRRQRQDEDPDGGDLAQPTSPTFAAMNGCGMPGRPAGCPPAPPSRPAKQPEDEGRNNDSRGNLDETSP